MHRRLYWALITAILLALPFPYRTGALGQDKKPDLTSRPITTAQGEVGDLLRKWWKEGTAAGNVGDIYDNRDRAHSQLDLARFPQLRQLDYTEEEIKQGRHWAAQRVILPGVVFGNSSTSAHPRVGGSNVRMYYTLPKGLEFLYRQYTRNNLYIYPEHRDHDPGRTGPEEGFGDLFPTNTPYVITSQGSSGSDQPFMRAVPLTLAAFRPEVKKQLIEKGFLMPTVQLILRASGKQLKETDDYLTGKAHPTVFEGSLVDEVKMVKMAHDIRLENIPAAIQMRVVEEDVPTPGRDFFEPAGISEKLADTPVVIARIFRGKDRSRRMVVSAAKSIDLNKRPLKYHWVLLRGDPTRVRITPLGDDKSQAEIVVDYQERRPISPGAPLESNRVDIGVFAHNGEYYSAPGFITYFTLDHEARIYDKTGKIVEIGYGLGQTRVTVTDWPRAIELAAGDTPAGRLLPIPAADRAALIKDLPEFQKLQAALKTASARRDILRKGKKDNPDFITAEKAVTAAQKAIDAFLDRRLPRAGQSLRSSLAGGFHSLATDMKLAEKHTTLLEELLGKAEAPVRAAIEAGQKRLADLGLIKSNTAFPVRVDKTPLSPYARCLIEHFNAEVLSRLVYPGVITVKFHDNFVDPRISVPRYWRDVYRYGVEGQFEGW